MAAFIDASDVVRDSAVFQLDLRSLPAAAEEAPRLTRERAAHGVSSLTGMHIGAKPTRAAPLVELLTTTGDHMAAGRLHGLPLLPVVSNPINTDVASFLLQWEAAENERGVAYTERERMTAWLLNPFVQHPPPEGRRVTATADTPVYSEAAAREMRALAGEVVTVAGFRRPHAEDDDGPTLDVDAYIKGLRALTAGQRVTVVRNGLGGGGPAPGAVKSVSPQVSIELDGGGGLLTFAPDRYPGFFVFPEDADAVFGKVDIVHATPGPRSLDFVLPTTSTELARAAMPAGGLFGSRGEMHRELTRAAAAAGLSPPPFDTQLWAAFPSVERPPAPPPPPVAATEPAEGDAAADEEDAATVLRKAVQARFEPADEKERLAALAAHAAESERGRPAEGPRVSLLSLSYGPPPPGAVVDLGFVGVTTPDAASLYDPATGLVMDEAALRKLRAAQHAPLAAELAEAFSAPAAVDRHLAEHFTAAAPLGEDPPGPASYYRRTAPTPTTARLLDTGFADAVAAPGQDGEGSALDAAVLAFVRALEARGRGWRVHGAHLARLVVAYFAGRMMRTRYPAPAVPPPAGDTPRAPPPTFWLDPDVYHAMARTQDDDAILEELGALLQVYVPAAFKALVTVGAVHATEGGGRPVRPAALLRQLDDTSRPVERVTEAMLAMEGVLRGLSANASTVSEFPDAEYAAFTHRTGRAAAALDEELDGLPLLRPRAPVLNMAVIPPPPSGGPVTEEEGTSLLPARPPAGAEAAEVAAAPPIFDAPVQVAPQLPGLTDPPKPTIHRGAAAEFIAANPELFAGAPNGEDAAALTRWLDSRVSELLPESGLPRELADRIMRAPVGAARHALMGVVRDRLGPLLRVHRPQAAPLARRDLLGLLDADTAVAFLMFVLLTSMTRGGPMVHELLKALEVGMDEASLDARVLEDRYERMREAFRQENYAPLRALDNADRAIYGELLAKRVMTVGDVREAAAAVAALDEEEVGDSEMLPVNREEYDDDE